MPKLKIKIWRVLAYSALGVVLFLAFTPSTLALDPTEAGQYRPVDPVEQSVVKTIPVMLTVFSPRFASKDDCNVIGGRDWSWGIDAESGDGGHYIYKNTRSEENPYWILEWFKGNDVTQRVYAEPTSNDIIPWDKIEDQGVLVPGFLGGKIVQIHDHFPDGVATNRNFLGLSVSCVGQKDFNDIRQKISKIPGAYKNDEGFWVVNARIIDLSKLHQLKQNALLAKCSNLQDPTAADQQKIYNFFKHYNSPLADYASSFIKAAQTYKISPLLLASIAGHESGWMRDPKSRSSTNKNPGNVKTKTETLQRAGIPFIGHDDETHAKFSTYEWGIMAEGEALRRNYFNQGQNTIEKIGPKWASMRPDENQDWVDGVNYIMQKACLI